jgi:hypothetical protein
MEIEFDDAKNRKNVARGRASFEQAKEFDFDSAYIVEDDDIDYGETRYRGIGLLGIRVVVLVWTMRGETVRVISLRHATKKERKLYDEG